MRLITSCILPPACSVGGNTASETRLPAPDLPPVLQAFTNSKRKQAGALVQQAPSIARAMLQVYQGLHALSCSAGGSAGMRHCSFTPRDLTAWVEGLQRCVCMCVVVIGIRSKIR